MSERASSDDHFTDGNSPGRDVRRLPGGAAASSGGTGAKTIARREIERSKEHDLVLGGALARIERERTYGADGASSAAHWAVLHGLDHGRASELLRLGRLTYVKPEIEQDVRDGTLTTQHAAEVGKLVAPTPALPPKHEPDPAEEAARAEAELDRLRKFAGLAKNASRRELSRAVNEEKESVKQQGRVTTLVFHVKQVAKDDWRFARKLASRKAQRPLSDGEAFSLVVADFVKRYDTDDVTGQKSARERRVGPTSESPDARTIPAEVRREVKKRAGDHCEFPGCPNGMFIQICHLRPHADGGDRETKNLVLLCSQHHTMMDCGTLRFFERTEAGVAFVDVRTGEVFEPFPTRHAADVLPGTSTVLDADSESVRRPLPGDATVASVELTNAAETPSASDSQGPPISPTPTPTPTRRVVTPEAWRAIDGDEPSGAGRVGEGVLAWLTEPASSLPTERRCVDAHELGAGDHEGRGCRDRCPARRRSPLAAGTGFR